MLKKVFFSLLMIVLGLSQMNAQRSEVGVLAGASLYSGDLSPMELGLYPNDLNLAVGLFGRLNVGRAFAARLGVNYTKLSADDMDNGRPQRGLNFRTNILEFSLLGELHLFRLGDKKGVQVVPYLAGGVGVYSFNPEGRLENNWVELQPLGTEGQGLPGYDEPYSLTQLNIPAGAGLKFIVKDRVIIGAELVARKLFTDYLDDITAREVNYVDILDGNGSLAARFSNPSIEDPTTGNQNYTRGGEYDDWYYLVNFTVSFRVGEPGGRRASKHMGCPTF